MGQPRQLHRGGYFVVSRRVEHRGFRLRPGPETNQILRYCLAHAAQKYGVRLFAFVAMGNHYHLVVQDTEELMPKFLKLLNMLSAKALNYSHKTWGHLWEAEPPSMVQLPTLNDVVNQIAYAAANPVEAGLVRSPEHWPGACHWLPGKQTVRRPAFFSAKMPLEMTLEFVQPEESEESEQRWLVRVGAAVWERVGAACERIRGAGRKFMGRKRVLGMSTEHCARSFERRRALRPRFAAQDEEHRRECIRRHKAFQAAYREALSAWKKGDRLVAFPQGTWWMRVHHGASVTALIV
ncbi:MAG: hypothetical protein CSA75_05155 [Sorangium cellulosum]|nr:MAG: hypothetical protein CSA75_05155 [Sorangium cellulosum]